MKKWSLALLGLCSFKASADTYQNFLDLSQHEVAEKDFHINKLERGSPFSVLAIHGGRIEFKTSDLAQVVAGTDLNLYAFEGIKSSGNQRLHLTSIHFDEPNAVRMVRHTQSCLSLHGFKNEKQSICVGGLDEVRAERIANSLAKTLALSTPSLEVVYPCEDFPATEENNIVNRCAGAGVQLEFSSAFRQRLSDPVLLNEVGFSIRQAWLDP